MLCAGVDIAAARTTLDNARATVAAKLYRLRESDAPLGEITFSAGVTRVDPDQKFGTNFHRADVLLYRAKEEGRNRVESD